MGRHEADSLEARYANYIEVGHNASEFLIDFGQCYQPGAEARVHTRIVTNPVYAKRILETLRLSLDQYEQTWGPIQDKEK